MHFLKSQKQLETNNIYIYISCCYVGTIAQSVYRLARGWTDQGSNPGEGDVFRALSDRPRFPRPSFYNGYRIFPGGNAAEACCRLRILSSSEVANGLKIWVCLPPPSCACILMHKYILSAINEGQGKCGMSNSQDDV